MTTRMRLIVTLGFGLLFGAWMAFVQAGFGQDATALGALLLLSALGAIVRRWWVLLALLGPLAALAYLEFSGYVGNGEEWSEMPLLSPPGIAGLIWFGMFLLLGVWLGIAGEWLGDAWRRRSGQKAQGAHSRSE